MNADTTSTTRARLRDPQQEAQFWLSLMPKWEPRDNLVILGVGQGHHIKEVEKRGLYTSLHLVDFEMSEGCGLQASLRAAFHSVAEVQARDLPLPLVLLPFRPVWQGKESLFTECSLRITGRRDRSLKTEFGDDSRSEALRLFLQELVR